MSLRHGRMGPIPFDEIVVADTETTGLCPRGLRDGKPSGDPDGPDRLCSASFLLLRRRGGGWIEAGSLSFLCDPGRPVGAAAAAVNGFHWSGSGQAAPEGLVDLRGFPAFAGRAAALAAFAGGRPWAFHHAAFDAAVLDAELGRAGLPLLSGKVLCTKKAFCDMRGLGRPDAYVPGTSLDALCDLLSVDRSGRSQAHGGRHESGADCRMAASCLQRLDGLGWMLAEDAAAQPHRRPATFPADPAAAPRP